MAAELIRDDPAWWYLGFLDTSTRRLRIWRIAPGRLVAVVTERLEDAGTSITNAAEMIGAQLAIEHPNDTIEIIEHSDRQRVRGARGAGASRRLADVPGLGDEGPGGLRFPNAAADSARAGAPLPRLVDVWDAMDRLRQVMSGS